MPGALAPQAGSASSMNFASSASRGNGWSLSPKMRSPEIVLRGAVPKRQRHVCRLPVGIRGSRLLILRHEHHAAQAR